MLFLLYRNTLEVSVNEVQSGTDKARVLEYCAAYDDLGHRVVLTFKWTALSSQLACMEQCTPVSV